MLDDKIQVLEFDEAWHVGDMDVSKRDVTGYEADLLSVSYTPASWRKIAKLSGDLWKLERSDSTPVRLLDAHAFHDNHWHRSSFTSWGVMQNLIKNTTIFIASWHDDEMDTEMSQCFETMEELEQEHDPEDVDIQQRYLAFVLTDKALEKYGLIRNGSQFNLDYAFVDYARTKLMNQLDVDGIYWDDEFDPLRYSAPRGGIFNERLDQFDLILERGQELDVEETFLEGPKSPAP
ncbi:hypothetical protein [Sulfitobacter sp. R18_1]|uniref:hypothetical protein n=1 Tax=Sulfitobacter sp. R18_1 TaxID=2821104 RepID=UPI001ADD4159|nr:hypothetical protein [Sulfitobacter sp. R18_1]MBO9428824.1 hypothetical protein [Sulfitobacter sp. R18_1]